MYVHKLHSKHVLCVLVYLYNTSVLMYVYLGSYLIEFLFDYDNVVYK